MSSRIAGRAVMGLAGIGVWTAVYMASPETAVLGFWVVSAVTAWWLLYRTANPAPPPPPEGAEETNPQFSVVQDEHNPQRSHIVWHTERTQP